MDRRIATKKVSIYLFVCFPRFRYARPTVILEPELLEKFHQLIIFRAVQIQPFGAANRAEFGRGWIRTIVEEGVDLIVWHNFVYLIVCCLGGGIAAYLTIPQKKRKSRSFFSFFLLFKIRPHSRHHFAGNPMNILVIPRHFFNFKTNI